MNISKFNINPSDSAAVENAFQSVKPEQSSCCNWKEQFPYSPEVSFKMFHTGEFLMLRFNVNERYTLAQVTEDNGEVWTDSCVEFFIALDDKGYYNFETNCIGSMLLGWRKAVNEGVKMASKEILSSVKRVSSLPFIPFEERVDEINSWNLTLTIPASALFLHNLSSWDNLNAKINLYKCGDNLSHPHFLSWKPISTPKPNFHCPKFFSPVILETL